MPEGYSKGELARREILEAAQRLFLSKGYGGTSMRNIAQAAGGRAVAGVYNHFPNKQMIFLALLEARNPYDDLLVLLESAQGETAPDFISDLLRHALPMMLRHMDFLELLQIDLREFQGANFSQLIERDIWPHAQRVVQRLSALPGFKPLSPLVLIRLLASLVIGYTMTEQFLPAVIRDQLSPEAWVETYIESLLDGLTLKADPPS